MTIDVVSAVYAEESNQNEYISKLQEWNKNHILSVSHDEYGQKIPANNTELWNQLSKSNEAKDMQMPKICFKNKALILFNKAIRSTAF